MEIVIPVIVLLVVAIGLYILIKDQSNNNSNKTQEQMELQLNSFVESFKLTSAESMAKQLKESKDDKDKMTETLTKLTRELEKIKGTDLLNITSFRQLNLFLLKNIYDKWASNFETNKIKYFNYDSNDLIKATDTMMNILSNNISSLKSLRMH